MPTLSRTNRQAERETGASRHLLALPGRIRAFKNSVGEVVIIDPYFFWMSSSD